MDEEDLLDDDEFLDELDDDGVEELPEESASSSTEEDLLVKGLRQYGMNIPDGLDGKRLAAEIQSMARRQSSLPDDKELAELREYRARYQQDREASQRETPAPEKSSKKLAKPEGAEDYVVFDEKEGRYVPRDLRFPNIQAVEAMNTWHKQVESNKRRMLEDPEDYFKSTLNLDERLEEVKKTAKEEALNELRRQIQQEARDRERLQFWDKHAPELYEVDDGGYVKQDPITGQPMLSAKGLKYLEAHDELKAKHPNSDPIVLEQEAYHAASHWEKTQKARAARAAKKQQGESTEETEQEEASVEEPTAEEVAEEQKRAFAKKARAADEKGKKAKGDRVINRDASVVTAARTGGDQNDGVTDFLAIAKSEARKKGLKIF